MTAALPYVFIAILLMVVAALLAREGQPGEAGNVPVGECRLDRPVNGQFQKVADRIFDPSDFLWLRDALGRADLARALERTRKQLAILWLKSLRRSFNELVRTPEPAPRQSPTNHGEESWGLLWLTLRFHLLLAYALFVVRTFGPYHRLLPTLNWRRFLPESTSTKSRLHAVD
jgi:hypothetical protein